MANIPITLPPGVLKGESAYAATGRWIDADKVRFVNGAPEKIKGWERYAAASEDAAEVIRSLHSWRGTGADQVAAGTPCWLYHYDEGKQVANITPITKTSALTNKFSTTSGSSVVGINDVAHGVDAEETVYIRTDAEVIIGGLTIPAGDYVITTVVDVDNYEFDPAVGNATSTVAAGGGSVNVSYLLACGLVDGAFGVGWGVGPYGEEEYGDARANATGERQEARVWQLDDYGDNLLAAPGPDFTLYQFDPATDTTAQTVTNAPASVRGVFVTEERYVMALGATDPMTVKWPDVDDITDWTPSATNTANSRQLQEGRILVAGTSLAAGISVIWSDTAAYQFVYEGGSFIYASRLVGRNCGLVGPQAFAVVDGIAFWMSHSTFYLFNGTVLPIPRVDEIREYVFGRFATIEGRKVTCAYVKRFREIWWMYPSTGQTENDSYIAVNIDTWEWTNGSLARSAATNRKDLDATTIMADQTIIYEHEQDTADGNGSAIAPSLKSGLFALAEGEVQGRYLGLIPDFERITGTLTLTIDTFEYPSDATEGSEAVLETKAISLTSASRIEDIDIAGRYARLTLTGSGTGVDFRMGRHVAQLIPAARRR